MAPTTSPVPAPATRPLRADAERNRRLILDAAREVFAERGLEAGFDEVARRAGVGVGTVYRRFPDRDDLVDALFSERIDEMVDLTVQARAMGDPWEALVWFFERSVRAQSVDRAFKEVMGGGTRGHERLESARQRMKPAVTALVERAREAGVLRHDIEALDLAALGGMLAQVTTEETPELWRRYLPLLLSGLRAGTVADPLPLEAPDEEQLAVLMHGEGARQGRPRSS